MDPAAIAEREGGRKDLDPATIDPAALDLAVVDPPAVVPAVC
jgi:hypothetical protein